MSRVETENGPITVEGQSGVSVVGDLTTVERIYR